MIVVDETRSVEVHLQIWNVRGSQVIKISTEEYFRRMFEKEMKRKLAIKCLRNKVETLKKELVTKEHSLRKEKEEAVSGVRSFRRDSLMEGCSRGGKMVKAALQKK